jgi:SAM-dependent methyltransferase
LYAGSDVSRWAACARCGFVHQNPRPSLAALARFYGSGQYHAPQLPGDVDEFIRFANWYYSEKVEYAIAHSGKSSGSVLEIGAGLGGALRLFSERGWSVFGVEPDPRQAQFATRELHVPNVQCSLVDDSFRLDSRVDLVFSNHAFEHFSDLDSVMRAITRVLKPGGRVFTAVPTYLHNRSSVSRQWMNSAHYSLFTHRSLNQLFSRHGLNEVSHTYRGWRKEVDDLWHMARFDAVRSDPAEHYEDARTVQRYVNVVNPLRTVLYAPLFAGHARRVAVVTGLAKAGRLFRQSPTRFVKNLPGHLRRWWSR